jgi:hypothetical protein
MPCSGPKKRFVERSQILREKEIINSTMSNKISIAAFVLIDLVKFMEGEIMLLLKLIIHQPVLVIVCKASLNG